MASAAVTFACAAPIGAHAQIALTWPLTCTVGRDCEIQHYMAHGKASAAQDYTCGPITARGQTGTDIRLANLAAQQAGVDVLAAAAGKVAKLRDGYADGLIRSSGRDSIPERDCGNSVVLTHADGFETQYCHVQMGSFQVKAGDMVTAGQKLGRLGLSGQPEFPHLNFTVKQNGKPVDPFAYGQADGACSGGTSLWPADLQTALTYKAGTILNAGFAPQQITLDDVESGAGKAPITLDSPSIFAFVRTITLRKGDIQSMLVVGPHGPLLRHAAAPLALNRDQVLFQLGRKHPTLGWEEGDYTATYTVTREGKVLLQKTFTTRIGPK